MGAENSTLPSTLNMHGPDAGLTQAHAEGRRRRYMQQESAECGRD